MRFSLPTRVPLPQAFVFASVFFCIQQFQHTDILFSLLYFAFLILTVLAFNFAEGFSRLTGAYIFWYALLIVIVGVTWKAVLGEPANSNLFSPLLDMALYAGSMFMLMLVTLLNKKLDFRYLGIGGGFAGSSLNYTAAGLGCLLVGYGIMFADTIFGQAPGGVISALIQVNVFPPLGLILSTIGAIHDSGGRRSTNMINIIGLTYFTAFGFLAFSKQAMLTPVVCWVIGIFYSRLKVRFIHVVVLILIGVGSFRVVSPLSASRDLTEGLSYSERVQLLGFLFTHWDRVQSHVKDLEGMANDNGVNQYYDKAQGSLLERLSMIPPDDTMIAYTAQGGNFEGIDPVINYFENIPPHFLAPNKQIRYSGNYYAHEIGFGIGADDYTTGISFSPVAEAYHCEGWGGIFWLLPVLWIMLFSSVDFVVGDLTKHPWGLMVVVWFAHSAPETLLGGIIYFMGMGNFGMFVAIVVVTRIAPIVGALFTGKSALPPARSIRPVAPLLSRPQV